MKHLQFFEEIIDIICYHLQHSPYLNIKRKRATSEDKENLQNNSIIHCTVGMFLSLYSY